MDNHDLRHQAELMRHYEALECASHEMLQAAREGDWDGVCRLEGACTVVIAQLRRLVERQPLDDACRSERIRILRTIIANDAELRRICDPMPALLDHGSFCVTSASMLLH